MSKNRRHKIRRNVNITTQTDYHLRQWARASGRDEGWVIDTIVRAWALEMKGRGEYETCMPDGEWPAAMECIQNMHRRLLELEKEREMLWKTVDRLEAEKKESNPGWIDVNDRVPELPGDYLVRYGFIDHTGELAPARFAAILSYFTFGGQPHFQHELAVLPGGNRLKVTHWMKIPEFKEKAE